MKTSRHWPSMSAMVVGLGLCLVVSATAPTPSHAIPVAGDYEFTNGLTGTFHSNGLSLTLWNITDPLGNVWQTGAPGTSVLINDITSFALISGVTADLSLNWRDGGYQAHRFLISSKGDFSFQAVTSQVPEPSSALLLLAGLCLLAGYGWGQRRQAGLQIG